LPAYIIAENIRNVVVNFGTVIQFKSYMEFSENSQGVSKLFRSELQTSGVTITDIPPAGNKRDCASKIMMIDIMAFAIDHPSPATIVLISGDQDFVYSLAALRNRRYTIVLIAPNSSVPIILKSQANAVLEWRYMFNEEILNMEPFSLNLMGNSTNQSENMIPSGNSNPKVNSADVSKSNKNSISAPANNSLLYSAAVGSTGKNSSIVPSPVLQEMANMYSGGIPLSNSSDPFASTVKRTGSSGSFSTKEAVLNLKQNEILSRKSTFSEKSPNSRFPFGILPLGSPVPEVKNSNLANSFTNPLNYPKEANPSRGSSFCEKDVFENKNKDDSKTVETAQPFFNSPKPRGVFDLFIEILEKFRQNGDVQPRRSKVGNELARLNPMIYYRAHCSSFKEYIDLAVKEGIVTIGGEKGLAWVQLNDIKEIKSVQ
jgi:hypothetical protein